MSLRGLAVNVVRFTGKANKGSFLRWSRPVQTFERWCGGLKDSGKSLDPCLLQLLVCPLSKKPLRYDETTNELINEELGIAYPIIDGIPNMIPQDARLIKKTEGAEEPTES